MRTFAVLAMECLGMAVPTLRGVISREWKSYEQEEAKTKADILRLWDAATVEINEL
jgi:hypothetical protein